MTQGLQRSKLLLLSLLKIGQNCPFNKRTLMFWTQGARSSDTVNCFPEITLDTEKQRIYSRHSSMINESQYNSQNICKWQKLTRKKTHQCVLLLKKKAFFQCFVQFADTSIGKLGEIQSLYCPSFWKKPE